MGNIYDMVEEAVYRIMEGTVEYKRRFFWERMGTIFGHLFQDFLEDPKEF